MPGSFCLQSREIIGSVSGPRLLITGGVHGDEFEPMVAIRRLIANFESHPAWQQQLQGAVTFVPIVNESAFLRGHRTAEDGLDLARVCPGAPDGRPTEQVAHALSELIRAADYYIDLHTGGTEMMVAPLSGYCLHPNKDILALQQKMARAFNLPIVWGTSPEHEGRSLSIARDAGVPAIYTEYFGGGRCDPAGGQAYVDGCLNVMASLGMLQRPIPPSRVKYVVEDDRPQSGHLQVCNPSPITGYFQPFVELGQRIERGQALGTVTDALGTQTATVPADETGIVLVLRSFPRVKKGESTGAILRHNTE